MLMAFFSWWYGAGWRRQGAEITRTMSGLLDTFSITLLLKTLFSPFRQISVGSVDGPIGLQIRAFFDRLVSRIIGALIRFVMVMTGSVVIAFFGLWGMIKIIMWPLLPLFPVIGVILWLSGWVPWK